jgi:hypothetical protein
MDPPVTSWPKYWVLTVIYFFVVHNLISQFFHSYLTSFMWVLIITLPVIAQLVPCLSMVWLTLFQFPPFFMFFLSHSGNIVVYILAVLFSVNRWAYCGHRETSHHKGLSPPQKSRFSRNLPYFTCGFIILSKKCSCVTICSFPDFVADTKTFTKFNLADSLHSRQHFTPVLLCMAECENV